MVLYINFIADIWMNLFVIIKCFHYRVHCLFVFSNIFFDESIAFSGLFAMYIVRTVQFFIIYDFFPSISFLLRIEFMTGQSTVLLTHINEIKPIEV